MKEQATTRRVILQDIADRCGVSRATVSLALHRPSEHNPVAAHTRERVLRAAHELGYQRSWLGQALRNRRTHIVGWVAAGAIPLTCGVAGAMSKALAWRLWKKRYQLMIVAVTPWDKTWHHVLLDQRFDGCVVVDHLSPQVYDLLKAVRLPVVFLNLKTDLPFVHVLADDRDGAVQATRHLLNLGHRAIVYYCKREEEAHYSQPLREAGYTAAMREAGLGARVRAIKGEVSLLLDAIRAEREPVTAVLTWSHREAIPLLRTLAQAGVGVPRDVSLLSFNDVYPTAELLPALTVMEVPSAPMGRAAADALLECIEAEAPVEPRTIVLPESLIVRESTAPPRE
ncbi:MAG: LacI family DNA-binding transcriptional regulator [Kiritimatiellae bacterium]|nr:LacI family DNA-binding transcriptional regulator [Kiritimatiellia bacterium]